METKARFHRGTFGFMTIEFDPTLTNTELVFFTLLQHPLCQPAATGTCWGNQASRGLIWTQPLDNALRYFAKQAKTGTNPRERLKWAANKAPQVLLSLLPCKRPALFTPLRFLFMLENSASAKLSPAASLNWRAKTCTIFCLPRLWRCKFLEHALSTCVFSELPTVWTPFLVVRSFQAAFPKLSCDTVKAFPPSGETMTPLPKAEVMAGDTSSRDSGPMPLLACVFLWGKGLTIQSFETRPCINKRPPWWLRSPVVLLFFAPNLAVSGSTMSCSKTWDWARSSSEYVWAIYYKSLP